MCSWTRSRLQYISIGSQLMRLQYISIGSRLVWLCLYVYILQTQFMPGICVSFFCTTVKSIQRVREPEVGFSIYQLEVSLWGFSIYQLEVGLCGSACMFTFCKRSLCLAFVSLFFVLQLNLSSVFVNLKSASVYINWKSACVALPVCLHFANTVYARL